jgi:hypothetical protein
VQEIDWLDIRRDRIKRFGCFSRRGRFLSLARRDNPQQAGKGADQQTTAHSNLTITTIPQELTLKELNFHFHSAFLLRLAEFGGVVQLDLSASSLLG